MQFLLGVTGVVNIESCKYIGVSSRIPASGVGDREVDPVLVGHGLHRAGLSARPVMLDYRSKQKV